MAEEEVCLRLALADLSNDETVRVTPLGTDRYRLEDSAMSSLFSEELQLWHGDIIQAAREPDGALRFRTVIIRSPLQRFDWILSRLVVESAEFTAFLEAVTAAGGYWEHFFGGCLLVHQPQNSAFDPEAAREQVIALVQADTGGAHEVHQ
jgi:hypothetical protein